MLAWDGEKWFKSYDKNLAGITIYDLHVFRWFNTATHKNQINII
jgi:hypothetical protein